MKTRTPAPDDVGECPPDDRHPGGVSGPVIQGKAETILSFLPTESIHLILGSPPYDGIRDYHGSGIDLPSLGADIARVLVPGGVAVIVIQDQTENGHKSLTSFSTACAWATHGDLGLFETLIWNRPGVPGAWWGRRFRVDHEFVLVFSRGKRPRVFDKDHMKIPAIYAGTMQTGGAWNTKGEMVPNTRKKVSALKCPGTVMTWNPTKCEPRDEDRALKRNHPATFPQALVSDLIRCFTEPGDMVLDPFAGSGSTLVEAKKLDRRYLGIEPSEVYRDLALRRLALLDLSD